MLQTVAARDQIESDKGLLRISQRALNLGYATTVRSTSVAGWSRITSSQKKRGRQWL